MLFFIFISVMVYPRILTIVPGAVQEDLVCAFIFDSGSHYPQDTFIYIYLLIWSIPLYLLCHCCPFHEPSPYLAWTLTFPAGLLPYSCCPVQTCFMLGLISHPWPLLIFLSPPWTAPSLCWALTFYLTLVFVNGIKWGSRFFLLVNNISSLLYSHPFVIELKIHLLCVIFL